MTTTMTQTQNDIQNPDAIDPLPAPEQYEPGTILTVRMRGHSRSPGGLDYFAPAVVLDQFDPDGQISILVWDSSAGTHYHASYPIREIANRGDGPKRQPYVTQSNIGKVLFSPAKFEDLTVAIDVILHRLSRIEKDLAGTEPAAAPVPAAAPSATPIKSPPSAGTIHPPITVNKK